MRFLTAKFKFFEKNNLNVNFFVQIICAIDYFVVLLHPKRYKNREILQNYTRIGIELQLLI